MFFNCSYLWGWERVSQTQLFEPRTPRPNLRETEAHGLVTVFLWAMLGLELLTCFAITNFHGWDRMLGSKGFHGLAQRPVTLPNWNALQGL